MGCQVCVTFGQGVEWRLNPKSRENIFADNWFFNYEIVLKFITVVPCASESNLTIGIDAVDERNFVRSEINI